METDEWRQDPAIMVAPLSLKQFWDCFLEDDSPYNTQAMMVDPEDIVLLGSDWRAPTQGHEVLLGKPVIQEWILEKSIRMHQAFVPDFVEYYARYSLIERNETYIRIFEQHTTTNAPYTDTF